VSHYPKVSALGPRGHLYCVPLDTRQPLEIPADGRTAWFIDGDEGLRAWAELAAATEDARARARGQASTMPDALSAWRPVAKPASRFRVVAADSPRLAIYYVDCLERARDALRSPGGAVSRPGDEIDRRFICSECGRATAWVGLFRIERSLVPSRCESFVFRVLGDLRCGFCGATTCAPTAGEALYVGRAIAPRSKIV
jgi:hypothetical protein